MQNDFPPQGGPGYGAPIPPPQGGPGFVGGPGGPGGPGFGAGQQSTNPTTMLVLGVLGVICCPLAGVAALVMSNGALQKINAGQAPESERSMVNIARILGIIACVLMVLGFIARLAGVGANRGTLGPGAPRVNSITLMHPHRAA